MVRNTSRGSLVGYTNTFKESSKHEVGEEKVRHIDIVIKDMEHPIYGVWLLNHLRDHEDRCPECLDCVRR